MVPSLVTFNFGWINMIFVLINRGLSAITDFIAALVIISDHSLSLLTRAPRTYHRHHPRARDSISCREWDPPLETYCPRRTSQVNLTSQVDSNIQFWNLSRTVEREKNRPDDTTEQIPWRFIGSFFFYFLWFFYPCWYGLYKTDIELYRLNIW